jgi:hypothetical protein
MSNISSLDFVRRRCSYSTTWSRLVKVLLFLNDYNDAIAYLQSVYRAFGRGAWWLCTDLRVTLHLDDLNTFDDSCARVVNAIKHRLEYVSATQ